jgi:hypothetical protein
MSRILVAVVALCVLGYLAYRTLYGRAASVGDEAPTQQLQNVREKAKEIEVNDQQHVDDVEKRTQE